jgi:spermidine synthase
MHSFTTTSEVEMGERVAHHLAAHPVPRYLIGGLGLGFTLKAVLNRLPPDGRVVVAELLPAIIEWNRTHLHGLNGALLEHPQVEIREGDVNQLLRDSPADHFDGILLDIDNGPVAMVQADNAALYTRQGIELLRRVLAPGGQIAFWSASPDAAFIRRLQQSGCTFEAVPTRAYPGAKRAQYVIYYVSF